MKTNPNYIFAFIHTRGNKPKYIKTNEEGILKIYNAIEDTEITIAESTGYIWENNIRTGLAYEAITDREVRETIIAILKHEVNN